MINIATVTQIAATGFSDDFVERKQIRLLMDADDAFSLAMIFLNMDRTTIPEDWQQPISDLSQQLIDAGNKCR